MCFFIIVLVVLGCNSAYSCYDNRSACSVWSHHPRSSKCYCGPSLEGGILCLDDKVYLRVDLNMYIDTDNNQTLAGLGSYGYHNFSTVTNRVYTLLPSDEQQFNMMICSPKNRKGFLCEECIDDHSPTVFNTKCANCTEQSYLKRAVLFFAVKLLPISLMFILVLVFRLNVTQGPIFGYIISCQTEILMAQLMQPFKQLIMHQIGQRGMILQVSLFFSSFWYMDYSSLFGNFCISPSFKNVHVLLLNYISVFYPLLLILSTAFLIELHARNYRFIVFMWKPFSSCLYRLRKSWSSSDSIVHAYGTLFILSFSTLNFNAYLILRSTNLYTNSGELYKRILYFQPSIHFNSRDYVLYFSIIAIPWVLIGVLPTFLLCALSVKTLRKKLNTCCSHRVQIIMQTFADTFQGTFRGGYRGIPVIYAFLVILLTFSGIFGNSLNITVIQVYSVVIILISFLVAFTRPCKSFSTNISLSFNLLIMAAVTMVLSHYIFDIGDAPNYEVTLLLCLASIRHIVMLLWLIYKVLLKFGFIGKAEVSGLRLVNTFRRKAALVKHDSSQCLLPDRLENSHNYQELSSASPIN